MKKIAEIAKIFWSVAKQMTHEAGNVKPGGGMAWCSKKYEKANTSREWPRLCKLEDRKEYTIVQK